MQYRGGRVLALPLRVGEHALTLGGGGGGGCFVLLPLPATHIRAVCILYTLSLFIYTYISIHSCCLQRLPVHPRCTQAIYVYLDI